MWVYVARRVAWLPFLLFAVSLVTFALLRVAPGDPVQVWLGQRFDEETAERLRESLGLKRPYYVQYGTYMWGVLRLDFGESFTFRGQPVGPLLGRKMWVSFQVNTAAMILSVGVGLPLGFWIARRQGTWRDPTAVAISVMLAAIPIMVSIPVVLWVMCLKLGWVPCSGWGGFWDPRIVVPAITMGVPGIVFWARLLRASTLDVMGQDFIRTAHAKGLTTFTVDNRHILRNALIPIVTMVGFALAGMLTTSFIVERILGIPGVGNLLIESVFQRDYPVIMAGTLIGASAFVVANLIADLAYGVIDPRIRYQ